ncbi:MAG: hypothetical protein A3J28_14585 [Acidobacteria bacterium RIFCSPLOWO2_12_FULL_60_22]|nr:MAG: hypothetical protein A3J28_14585 [Acidobacteria bacterium RIFCSPLOWO2_12_FULL_60_22]
MELIARTGSAHDLPANYHGAHFCAIRPATAPVVETPVPGSREILLVCYTVRVLSDARSHNLFQHLPLKLSETVQSLLSGGDPGQDAIVQRFVVVPGLFPLLLRFRDVTGVATCKA